MITQTLNLSKNIHSRIFNTLRASLKGIFSKHTANFLLSSPLTNPTVPIISISNHSFSLSITASDSTYKTTYFVSSSATSLPAAAERPSVLRKKNPNSKIPKIPPSFHQQQRIDFTRRLLSDFWGDTRHESSSALVYGVSSNGAGEKAGVGELSECSEAVGFWRSNEESSGVGGHQ